MDRQERPLPSRRHVLHLTGALTVSGLAGCLRDNEPPSPVSLTGEKYCDVCGMLIEVQPGPVGQTFFQDFSPEDRGGPAWFCSGVCTYAYTFDRERAGDTTLVPYMTDYSHADWQMSAENDTRFISAHLEAEAFEEAAALTLVVGSDLLGAMGPDLIGFSNLADAEAVASEYGGTRYQHDEVTPELVGSLMG